MASTFFFYSLTLRKVWNSGHPREWLNKVRTHTGTSYFRYILYGLNVAKEFQINMEDTVYVTSFNMQKVEKQHT